MDLTVEEPEGRPQNRRRGRMAYYEEDQESDSDGNRPATQKIQPPSNLSIAHRYQIYWTHVVARKRVATYSVSLDIDPHLMVLDVVDLALLDLGKMVKDAAAKMTLKEEASKWEMRFAGKDGLPRYDYPCKCL